MPFEQIEVAIAALQSQRLPTPPLHLPEADAGPTLDARAIASISDYARTEMSVAAILTALGEELGLGTTNEIPSELPDEALAWLRPQRPAGDIGLLAGLRGLVPEAIAPLMFDRVETNPLSLDYPSAWREFTFAGAGGRACQH